MKNARTVLSVLVACVCWVSLAGASGTDSFGSTGGYSPQVPISGFARPASWFDPSRLHVTAEMNYGSGGWNGGGSGLQVTRFDYRFGNPLSMRVSVGNAFGAGVQKNGQFFLEGLDLRYQPWRSLTIQVNYRDMRSPLQYGMYGYGTGPWSDTYGYGMRSGYERGPFDSSTR
jgi:hypothetical protein